MYKVIYNGFTLENNTKVIINVQDLAKIPVLVGASEFANTSGGIIYKRKLSYKDILISGTIIAASDTEFNEYKKNLGRCFAVDSLNKDLKIIYKGAEYNAIATCVGFDILQEKPGANNVFTFQAVLRCIEPFWRSQEIISNDIYPLVYGGTPVPSPIASPLSNDLNNLIINADTIDTVYPIVYIYGYCVNPAVSIVNAKGSSYVMYNGVLDSGDVLEIGIENNNKYALLNGSNVLGNVIGDFVKIENGTNVVRFVAAVYNNNARVKLKYFYYFL